MTQKFRTIALIVAAGEGSRMGMQTPKPYLEIGGKPILRQVMETFMSHPGIDGVRPVISRAHHPLYRKATEGLTTFSCVVGGSTRQESVLRGLESIADHKPERVLIHDAARPFVSHALISRVLLGLTDAPAVLPAMQVVDTLKRVQEEQVKSTVPRDELFAAQTPQGFHFEPFLTAHHQFRHDHATDDIALAERAGMPIRVVAGERANFKLTTIEDYEFMMQFQPSNSAASPYETRTGMGFDAHPFVPHDNAKPSQMRTIIICGVKIPHEQKLKGHSDADVGLHALVDAILGTIGAGDIGLHFPSDDPQWAGADSGRFLIHAYKLLKDKKGELVNLDITIMGETPRISPYREEMADHIADLLKLPLDRVNIKATTTERMGFLGRGEGLAAHALVTVKLPA